MADSGAGNILSSRWDGLSEHLIAKFYAVDSKGYRISGDSVEVHAPLLDANTDIALNWQSPFEQASPDTKAPALFAMLQSGALSTVMNDLTNARIGTDKDKQRQALNDQSSLETTLQEFQGRTGITKLNSVQIFTGMAPVKITCMALFRAYADPYKEVEQPFQQLMSWALPKKLSSDSIIKRAAGAEGVTGYLKALLPSQAPQLIGFQYKRRTYAPMVIENIGEPLNSPVASNGYYTELLVPMTIATLTALDRDDIQRIAAPGTDVGPAA